jgi:hypothetical protein
MLQLGWYASAAVCAILALIFMIVGAVYMGKKDTDASKQKDNRNKGIAFLVVGGIFIIPAVYTGWKGKHVSADGTPL